MRKGYHIANQQNLHFVTFTVLGWVDVFIKPVYKDIIIDNFKFYIRNQGLKVHAYVIMTNHVHAILSATEPKNDLSSIIGRIKSMSSKQLINAIKEDNVERSLWMLKFFRSNGSSNAKNTHYQLWSNNNHPVELSTNEMIDVRLDYIHNNPLKAGIVTVASQYVYSSAAQYNGDVGLLKIEMLE